MNAQYDWSVGIGRWMGIPVRVHLLLLLAVVGIFAVEWHYRARVDLSGTGLATAVVLVASILLHELAHVWTCVSLGGSVHSITFAPWGGFSQLDGPDHPGQRMLVRAAGPFANLVVFVLTFVLLLGMGGGTTLAQLTDPLRPMPFLLNHWESSLAMIVGWVNFQLFMVNMIPCFPFDLGQLVREVFTMTHPDAGRLRVENTLLALGQLAAATPIVMSFFMRDVNNGPLTPTWALLLAFGITLLFAARQDYRRQLREIFQGEGLSADDLLLLRASRSPDGSSGDGLSPLRVDEYSQWLSSREDSGAAIEDGDLFLDGLTDEELTDQILDKLHRDGIESLTVHERETLDRISRRLRDRRSSV